jgi:hypothetical protein
MRQPCKQKLVSLARELHMSIDLLSETEEPFRIAEAAQICRVHFSVVFRWISKGVPAADGTGRRVRLAAVRAGRQWLIPRRALAEFVEATTPRFDNAPRPSPRSPKHRRSGSERAKKALEAAGVC